MSTLEQSTYNDQDASSKWSGFNYQGKVAIYTVLYLINNPQYIDKENHEEWDLYSLEIEGLEDFSILKNNEYISIHQVKAYTSSNTPSKLTNAFWGLIGKSIENPTVKKSCIHTLKEVPKLRQRTSTNIEYIKNLIPDKKKELDYRALYITDESLLETAFNKLAFYSNHKSYKLCVSLNDINKLIIDEIKTYYLKNKYEEHKLDEKYLNQVLNNILGKIDEHIYKRHNKELTQYDCISFNDVINYIIETPDLVTYSYNLYHLKRYIVDTTLEYCDTCRNINPDICDCEICNLKKYIEQLISLDNEKFMAFIKVLNINIELNNSNLNIDGIAKIASQIIGYNNLLERIEEHQNFDGIKNNNIIHKINCENYLNTSVSHIKTSKKHKEVERINISQNILENIEKNTELMINLENSIGLISYNVDIDSVKKLANKIGKSNRIPTDGMIADLLPEYDNMQDIKDVKIIPYEKINQIGEVSENA